MKIDRMVGILTVLLQQEKVTAPYLAEKFEVSRRTINRDIEDLCKAGIPIRTVQGPKGGISIMEDYKLDNTLLTSSDMKEILTGLRGLDSVSGTNHFARLMEKLSPGSSDLMPGDQNILIDLSSWHKDSLTSQVEEIRKAIDQSRILHFQYFAPTGESERYIEPYYLIFQWANWYVWGYCKEREDFRLFKLNRMEDLEAREKFLKRSVPLPDFRNGRIFPGGIQVKTLFEPSCKWRLIEEFGAGCFQEQLAGKLLFQRKFTDKENLITWLLTFRDQVCLLEPEEIRREMISALKEMIKIYEAL